MFASQAYGRQLVALGVPLRREKLLSPGVYPDISFLKDARERRDEAGKLAAVVVDPRQARKAEKAARVERVSNSFEGIARVGLGKKSQPG